MSEPKEIRARRPIFGIWAAIRAVVVLCLGGVWDFTRVYAETIVASGVNDVGSAGLGRNASLQPGSLANQTLDWPTWEQWRQLLLLEEYNTRIVIIGVALLGGAAGMVGSFTLLRKRALMGDALSHATLPGIGLAFMIATALGGDGKSMVWLLLGATLTGLVGVGSILVIRNLTRLKEDTALGAVLSVFFGGGIAILGVVQQMSQGHAAGLESFIYGKTASMGIRDTLLIASAAILCIGVCLAIFKELKLLCFDEGFAASRGFPVLRLDMALMAVVVIVCIVGLQAVGLILVIALLVIPAAAARFWTEEMWRMSIISASIGAIGGLLGAGASGLFSRLPSGAMIVLVCTFLFMFSLVFGSSRGVLVRYIRRYQLNRSVDRQHLLRALYELLESKLGTTLPLADRRQSVDFQPAKQGVSIDKLLSKRSWGKRRLRRAVAKAERNAMVIVRGDSIALTRPGLQEAARLTRQHRLWELYLISHAEVAPARVDREADAIEHILEPEIISELEGLLTERFPDMPSNPHTDHESSIVAGPIASQKNFVAESSSAKKGGAK